MITKTQRTLQILTIISLLTLLSSPALVSAQQEAIEEYSINYRNYGSVKIYITYPQTVEPGDDFDLEIRVIHVLGSLSVYNVAFEFFGEPTPYIYTTTNNTFLFGDLSNGIEILKKITFHVSSTTPEPQTLLIKIDTWASYVPRQRLSPDIEIQVPAPPAPPPPTPPPATEEFILPSWVWPIIVISAVGVVAIFAIYRFTRQKASPQYIMTESTQYTGGKPASSGHRPSIIERRASKKK
jgi:hypothetical protein